MRNEQQFSNLIYEYFLQRIHLGYYTYGSTLPSIETMCREFSVSPQTVKKALQCLRVEGYIAMHNGRSTRVLFRETQQECRAFTQKYYSERRDVFPDLYRMVEQVINPLLAEGIYRMDDEDLAYVAHLTEHAKSSYLMHLYCFTLQKLENPLLMNLFWESALFQGFPFVQEAEDANIYNNSLTRGILRKIIACKKAGDRNGVRRILYLFQGDGFKRTYEYIKAEHCVHSVPKKEQISFTWRIYRGRPQLCYSLAVRLLHEIYIGEYRDEEFLPSYAKMADKYDASVSTMRRTVRLLTELGVVQPINGRGIRIFAIGTQVQEPDFTSPEVRQNLALFYQAFELIIFSCEAVICDTLRSLGSEEKAELRSHLEGYVASSHCQFSLWCILITIAMRNPLKSIREVYAKLYGLFLWGYPLKASLGDFREQNKLVLNFTEELILVLKEDAPQKCARLVREQVEQQFSRAEKYLHQHGVKAEELRNSPTIRLLLTSEPS